ncbi:DUF4382 domain-containing protein [Daejeonella oryzae]|uniref:DUF4382 domain-containing protein n=1 Tax=Daejeonella oryzae TaxID=1122943 RepID=UPI0004240FC6|nr:DUF4382 domain-containing protein [Daejeonella oryzae]
MKKLIFSAVAILSMAFTACNKESGTVTRLNVKMTDGPGAYDAIYLNIKEIQVISAGGESTLQVGSTPFDILKFRLGKDTLIASQDVPSGRLQEIRLVLNSTGNTVVVDGVSHNLTTPSGQTSGIKLKVQEELISGIAYTLLLDFDAAKSIVMTGNGGYQLKPVIRAIPQAVSGVLSGTVNPVTSNPKVYAITGTDTLGTVTDASGKFYFPGLAAGTYKVNFSPVSPFISKSIENVVIKTGSTTELGIVTLLQ